MEYLFCMYGAVRGRVLLRERLTSSQLLLLRTAELKSEATGTDFSRMTGYQNYEFARARKALELSALVKRLKRREDRRIVRLRNTSRGTWKLKRVDHAIEAEFLALLWKGGIAGDQEEQVRLPHFSREKSPRKNRLLQLNKLEKFLKALHRANLAFPMPDSSDERHYFDERDFGHAELSEPPEEPTEKSDYYW